MNSCTGGLQLACPDGGQLRPGQQRDGLWEFGHQPHPRSGRLAAAVRVLVVLLFWSLGFKYIDNIPSYGYTIFSTPIC